MHLNDALRYGEPKTGAAFLAGDGIAGLLKLLKQPHLVGSGDAGSRVTDRDMECVVVRFCLDGDLTRIRELNGVANEIDQVLCLEPPLMPLTGPVGSASRLSLCGSSPQSCVTKVPKKPATRQKSNKNDKGHKK